MLLVAFQAFGGQSELLSQEKQLAESERQVADKGDLAAWEAWRDSLNATIAAVQNSRWPSAPLNDLYQRGRAIVNRYAKTDALGIEARGFWAASVEEMARTGRGLLEAQPENFAQEDKTTFSRLWFRAHIAWQEFLLAEETRDGFWGFLDGLTGSGPIRQERSWAWPRWWDCLRQFCTDSPGFADCEIALNNATTVLKKYTGEHPKDADAWRIWSQMLRWQGQRSSDSVVRMAFLEDAYAKQERLLGIDPGSSRAIREDWQKHLRELEAFCLSTEECDAVRRHLRDVEKDL